MQAIVFERKNQPTLKGLPDPAPRAGEVVIEVNASGICHTDFEVLRGNYGASAFPLVPGHEYAGVIVDIGPEVKGLAIGDRVVVDPNLECGVCAACKRDWAHLCESLGAYGVTVHGGFAEFSVVAAARVHLLPADMGFDIGALAEPLGCVLNGLDAAQASRARNALIFGAGPIGLLMALALRGAGVGDIALADLDASRLELAQSFGFRAMPAQGDEMQAGHRSVDLVVDATGVAAVAAQMTRFIANGGVGLFFGVCPPGALIEISPFEMFRRQITLAGSHSLNHNIPQALALLRAHQTDFGRLVSHRMPLSEIAKVFAGHGPQKSLKVQYSKP